MINYFDFTSTPDINQELAWELDKKTFQQHKLQRSVIKCNAYATALSGQREIKIVDHFNYRCRYMVYYTQSYTRE
ncbi:unnamed protein product, partial [Rotaria socialis]